MCCVKLIQTRQKPCICCAKYLNWLSSNATSRSDPMQVLELHGWTIHLTWSSQAASWPLPATLAF